MSDYNGWKNYETWNVALWIQNDEGLYDFAKECVKTAESYTTDGPYGLFATMVEDDETPDGVAWNDSGLDIEALDEMIAEL